MTPELKNFFNFIRPKKKGRERRQFMARVVLLLGHGDQLKAERELGWDRKTILENHWKGELLDKIEKVRGLCRTMTWKGENPAVKLVKGVYPTGVRLAKSAMVKLEDLLIRIPGIEKWAVDITCYQE